MSCQIKYDDTGKVQVTAPNGQESILFKRIQSLPETTSDYQALDSWLKVYTDSFKKWYGQDWENLSGKKKDELVKAGYLDLNGEPNIFYRGDVTDLESFNYSPVIGKFGQGIYLAENIDQAQSFAAETDKKVYPIFLKPTNYKLFKDKLTFLKAVAEFNNTKNVPTEEQVKAYVESQHTDNTTIIGEGLFGKEYNTARKENVKSIFSEGIEVASGLLYDNIQLEQNKIKFTESFQEERKSDQFVEAILEKLQNNFGFNKNDAEHITPEHAELLTKDTVNPWKGQPAFFLDGKVYFVRGKLTYKTVIHEFSHPLVKAIGKDNNVLFNKIYEDIINTNQGKEFFREAITEYPELEATHDQIKEEVIVKAMTYASENKENPLSVSPIMAAINKLIYALKQMFRKITGKTVKNLSVDTTVEELADMLIDKTWNLDMSVIKDSDITSYMATEEQLEEELNRDFASGNSVASSFNIIDSNTTEHITLIRKAEMSNDYETIKLILSTPTGELTLEQIKKSMSNFTPAKRSKRQSERTRRVREATNEEQKLLIEAEIRIEELEEIKERNQILAKTLITMNKTARKAKAYIEVLADLPDQKEAFREVQFYDRLLVGYLNQIDNITKVLRDGGLKDGSAMREDLSTVRGAIRDAQSTVEKIMETAVSEILSDKFNEYNVKSLEEQDLRIAAAERELKAAKGESNTKRAKERLEMRKSQKEDMVTAPETMRKYLLGQMGDIGFISSQFENFISSQDKSIATLAAYVKEVGFKADVSTQLAKNMLLTDIKELTNKIGTTPDQLEDFSDLVLFTDKTTRRNRKTGELEDYEVHTLLNEHKNYKHTLSVLREKLNDAKEEYDIDPTDAKADVVTEINDIIAEHKKYFLRNQYVDEYYHADEELLSTKLGRDAKEEASIKFDKFLQYQTLESESDIDSNQDYQTSAQLLDDYKKLFSLVDDYGIRKQGDALAKAQLLRKNRDAKRKYHEFVPIKNAFQSSLKGAESKLRVQLEEEGHDPLTDEFKRLFEERRQQWIDKNTHYKNKDSFYEARANIFNKIKSIMDTVSDVEDPFAIQKELLLDALQGRKDDDGQPIGSEMTEEMLDKIKTIQQEIQDARENKTYESAVKKLPEGDRKTVMALYGALNMLQENQATSYYIDIVDELYRDIQQEGMAAGEEQPVTSITLDNVDMFLDPTFIRSISGKSKAFDDWFQANHILKTKIFAGKTEQEYERIRAWNIVKPRDTKKYSETTDVYDDDGKLALTIEGVPNMNYFERRVKDKYRTGYDPSTGKVDTFSHFDIQGYQLPKSMTSMRAVKDKYGEQLDEHNKRLDKILGFTIPWDYYINHEYNELKQSNSDRFKLLQRLKEFHHLSQEGLDRKKTLGFELPRERKDNYQYVTSGEAKKDALGKLGVIGRGVASIFNKQDDDFDRDLNYEDREVQIGAEAYITEDGSRIPIRGKYDIDINQVSKDVLNSLFDYHKSAATNKVLKELQPIAQAVRKLAENNPIEINNQKKNVIKTIANSTASLTGNTNNRKKLIDGMVEVLFEGKGLQQMWNKAPGLVKVHNVAMGISAHSFFSLDMVSALKNHFGAQFQIGLEAIGGKYYDMKSYYRARPWALNAMRKISQEIYRDVPKSLEVQMIDIFDAIQGRNEEKFGESASRSLKRDTMNLTWRMSTRKWLESQATLQIFGSIMHYTKVEQNGKMIRYVDAFEIDPATKTIRLKEGIDQKWAPGNIAFTNIKKRVHEVSGFLQGLYSNEEQGIINRNLAFRSLGALKKYFYKMFMHRFAASNLSILDRDNFLKPQERLNLATGETHMGYYWQNMLTLKEIVATGGKHAAFMNKDEKRALKIGAFELLKVYALHLAQMLIFASFGTDEDDKEKWSKIKNQTGALPTPFTNEEWADEFNLSGWSRAHLLLLIMNIEGEATHFIPGYGTQQTYDVLTMADNIAMTASYKAIIEMMTIAYYTLSGNEKAYYKRDTGGLKAKEADTNKLVYKMMKMGGVSGKLADPVTATKNQYNLKN